MSLYYVVYPASETAPTGAQIVSGLAWAPAVAAGNDTARVDTGSQSFPEVTGLAPGDYRAAFVVYDGSEYSNVDVSAVETVAGATAFDLIVDNAAHTQLASTPNITAAHTLTSADAEHSHTAQSTNTTAAHTLAPGSAVHGHKTEPLLLNGGVQLTTADATHAHEATHNALSVALALITHLTRHGHAVDNVTLEAIFALAFSGTVRDKNGALAARTVTALRESTQTVVATTTSDPVTGEYHILADFNEPHTLIFSGEADRNAIVYSGVMPG